MNNAEVFLWGSRIGAVSWVDNQDIGVFQYDPDFIRSEIQLSPLMMPLRDFPYEFPALERTTFRGLPGLLADSLPDKFGNAVFNTWLAYQDRTLASLNSVEQLCYIGKRGMGAVEYKPDVLKPSCKVHEIDIAKLVKISNKILDQRIGVRNLFVENDDEEAMKDILLVGTSAGGARAKAILAWNPATNEFYSEQPSLSQSLEHWIIKFDGVSNNRDKECADPKGYGKTEYAYYCMAYEAGIEMMPCRLYTEGGRCHFMTKRFDRLDDGSKIHMQSLGALTHEDYNHPASYSYEEGILIMKQLGLSQKDLEQYVLRAMFNVVGRNQDDHVKNIAFLMDKAGEWKLSPAFDVTYAYDPKGAWTSQHQMSINGKRYEFIRADLCSLAKVGGIKTHRACEMLDHVITTIRRWPDIAYEAGVAEDLIRKIRATHSLSLLD
jgi:serine/threonine-protein kinase HipA